MGSKDAAFFQGNAVVVSTAEVPATVGVAEDSPPRPPTWKSAHHHQVRTSRWFKETLLAGLAGGCIRFGEVDWAASQPVAKTISDREKLESWNRVW